MLTKQRIILAASNFNRRAWNSTSKATSEETSYPQVTQNKFNLSRSQTKLLICPKTILASMTTTSSTPASPSAALRPKDHASTRNLPPITPSPLSDSQVPWLQKVLLEWTSKHELFKRCNQLLTSRPSNNLSRINNNDASTTPILFALPSTTSPKSAPRRADKNWPPTQ